jgi:hypothetical protein
MVVYASFKEFEPGRLKHECMWLPFAALRTNVLKKVPGGWSRMMKVLMQFLFIDDGNIRDGFAVACLQRQLVFVGLGAVVGDEDALRQVWSAKGASGTLPCFECFNVCGVGRLSLVRDDPSGAIVDIGCTDETCFRRKTNEELWHQVDDLAAQEPICSPQRFKQLQQSLGLNHNSLGLLLDVPLRAHCKPLDVTTHDPTHVLFANGLATTEINLILEKLLNLGITFELLQTYIDSGWKEPRCLAKPGKLADVFTKSRTAKWKDARQLSFFASEVVTVVPLICHFVERPAIHLAIVLEVESFKTLACVVRLVMHAKLGGVDPGTLALAIKAHGDAFKLAYNGHGIKPKFHYARKLPLQLARDGYLQDTFALERKHSMLKAAAEHTDNTRTFEKTILSRAIALHANQLKTAPLLDGLHNETLCPELAELLNVRQASVGQSLVFTGTRCGRGDLIFIGDRAAEVQYCCSVMIEDGIELALLVRFCTFQDLLSSAATRWRREETSQLVLVHESFRLVLARLWREEADGQLVIVQ